MIALPSVLTFDHVVRAYTGGAPVLNDVSFTMQREEIVALLGRNGSGKTTLVNLAMGLLEPGAGTVRAFGLDPRLHPVEVKRRIGYVGEQFMLPPFFTVRDALSLYRSLYPTWDDAFAKELLERFALGAVARRRLAALSKGQRQQVALLCAVCPRPELLLLDEPAAGLDAVARREFLETAIQLLNREGSAILFSSHHLGDVERLGGRVLLIRDGRVAVDDSLDALRDQTSLVIVPRQLADAEPRLRAMPGTMHVRAVDDSLHAVMRGEPTQLLSEVRERLGSREVECVPVPFEELFIELAGEARGARPLPPTVAS